MARKPLPSVAMIAPDAAKTSCSRSRILLAALSAAVLAAVMTGCVIFKSVTSSQVGAIGNVAITTTACASDTAGTFPGYNPPDPACQGSTRGGNSGVPASTVIPATPSFNHVTTGLKTSTTTTDPSFSYTINSGFDRLLVVKIVASATTDTIAGVTYGGTALTALSEYAPGAGRWANHVFYLKHPPTGAANVVVDITAGVKLTVAMEQYNGVNQSSTFGTVATASSQAGSTAPTVNVTGASTDMITDSLSVVSDTAIPTVATPSPQVEDYEINTGATTTDIVGAGSHRASAGSSTTMSHTLSASRPWATVGFAIKASQVGSQLTLAYRIPDSVTAPSSFVSTDPSGGSAITFTQGTTGAQLASQLTTLEPPGSGKKWVGYLSDVQSYSTSGYQYFTVAPQFPLPQDADGSPFQTPFNYQVVVGFRGVDESTTGATSSRTVTCGSNAKAIYDDATSTAAPQKGICLDAPADISSDLSQATRDLGIVAGAQQLADAGAQATVPFTMEWSGAACFCAWILSASTNIPGATATPSEPHYVPTSTQSVNVSVNIPPETTPGTYNVTLTGTFTGGDESVRQQTNTVIVGEAFGLSPTPALSSFGTVTLNAQAQTKNRTMSDFGVIDSPGSSDQGWNVTSQGNTSAGKSPVLKQYCPPSTGGCGADPVGYVSGGIVLDPNSITLDTSSGNWSGGTGTTPSFSCNSGGCPIDAASATKIASAPNGGGTGLWSASGFNSSSLSLSTPSTLRALPSGGWGSETYHVDIVWTLNSGP